MKQVKIVVVGDSGCGKTSIIKSVTEQSFREDIGLTIGVDHTCIKNNECNLRIWDTAGLERFDSLTTAYYTSSDVIIIVYDVSNCETYENVLDKWIPKISRLNVAHLIIVGNKSDVSEYIYPTIQDTKHFRVSAKNMSCACIFEYIQDLYIEKSAKTGFFGNIYNKLRYLT